MLSTSKLQLPAAHNACTLVWRRREYVAAPPPNAAEGAGLVLSLAQRRRRAVYYSAPRAAGPVSRCKVPLQPKLLAAPQAPHHPNGAHWCLAQAGSAELQLSGLPAEHHRGWNSHGSIAPIAFLAKTHLLF